MSCILYSTVLSKVEKEMMTSPRPEVKPIYIISDGTGGTAEKMSKEPFSKEPSFQGIWYMFQIYPDIINAELAQDVFVKQPKKACIGCIYIGTS